MTYRTLKIDRRGKGVAWVLIDNPPANAISEALMADLEACAEELEADNQVRVIVVHSLHEKTFLAGADLKGMIMGGSRYAGDPDGIAKQSARMQHCFDRFAKLPKPVIAAINGYALGGGCEFALACDFRLMGKGKIGLTEVSLGLIPGAGGTQRMTHLLGRAKATELIFMARKLDAEEAFKVGLITKVVSPDAFEEEITAFAEELSEGAVKAMGLAKRAMNGALGSIENGLDIEAHCFQDTFKTGEPGVGLQAFFQKKKPQFLR